MKNYLMIKQYGLGLLAILVLLVSPMSLLVSHIDLLSDVSFEEGLFYTLLTDSAGSQGFLITLLVLSLLVWRKRPSTQNLLANGVQLGVILLIGFAAKTGLKIMTESPRPYTELLSHQLLIPQPEHFYKLNSTQKAEVIDGISTQVSQWRTRHWQGEKDYSFPSGHTIFVAICIAFFGGLFVQSREYGLAAALMLWGLGVAYSRLWLGMHRPIDLVGSIVFVSAVYLLVPQFHTLSEKILLKLPILTHK